MEILVLFPISQNLWGYPKHRANLNFHLCIQHKFIEGVVLTSRVTTLTTIGVTIQFKCPGEANTVCQQRLQKELCYGVSLFTNSGIVSLTPPRGDICVPTSLI